MLTASDVVRMTDRMAASLASRPEVASRGAQSPRWTWSLDKVSNRTEHIMDENERWLIMARFRAQLSQSMLARERAVRFILPPDAWERYASGDFDPEARRLTPTHALRAEFRSDTHTSLAARTDAYLCAFQLIDLADGAILWEDAYETEYRIRRNKFD